MPECKCGQIPAHIKIIKIGESEVGIPDLNRIIRDVYFERLTQEEIIREELLNRVGERIFIPEERRELYSQALLQEYLKFATRVGKKETWQQGLTSKKPKKVKGWKGLVSLFKPRTSKGIR